MAFWNSLYFPSKIVSSFQLLSNRISNPTLTSTYDILFRFFFKLFNLFSSNLHHREKILDHVYSRSHYDALGLTPKATQGEIKAAYYKLSMIYHPDKNKGSESASEKFKAITSAYEVLGNFKLRRLYDRGLVTDDVHLKGWGSQEPKDSSIKGARIQTTRGTYSGRTPIYDFDEWSRIHYGEILQRRTNAKTRYEKQFGPNSENKLMIEREGVMFTLLLLLCSSFFLFSYAYRFSSLDSPPEKSNGKK